MNIINKKNLYFAISLAVIIPGLVSLFLFGLNFSIDFVGGTRLEYQIKDRNVVDTEIGELFRKQGIKIESISRTRDIFTIRTAPINEEAHKKISSAMQKQFGAKEVNFEVVGPTIGAETKNNAIKAVLFASVAILLYIAFAFREVSKPVASWKFGVCAIIALLHDILVTVGIFSILGHFFGVEADSLFITALLTIMGFSVHDTIVVFDRIRENLKRSYGLSFEKIVNNSILETFNRSLNTSLTVVLVLVTLLLFSEGSIKWFVVALLVGIISGTYSSIFNASPLLVVWHEWDSKRKK
jgi:preprotein translocase subunit SecF